MPNLANPRNFGTGQMSVPSVGPGTGSGSGSGGTYMNYDPRIGNAALPPGIQGTQNRAYTRQVQNPELSQTQMQNITSQNSPLMRSARAQGMRLAGARGMLNSSMAGEASQNAVIQNAMPMALQDAQAYQEAAGQNLQYLNQRDIANMQDWTNQQQINAGIEQQRLGDEAMLARQRENLAYSGEQAELQRRYGFQTMGLENQFLTDRDYRQFGFDEASDWRGYDIESRSANQRFNYDMMARQWDSQNQMRQMAYQGIFEANMSNPQEFDEFINSGMMEYWIGSGPGSASNYFNNVFGRIYGG